VSGNWEKHGKALKNYGKLVFLASPFCLREGVGKAWRKGRGAASGPGLRRKKESVARLVYHRQGPRTFNSPQDVTSAAFGASSPISSRCQVHERDQ